MIMLYTVSVCFLIVDIMNESVLKEPILSYMINNESLYSKCKMCCVLNFVCVCVWFGCSKSEEKENIAFYA